MKRTLLTLALVFLTLPAFGQKWDSIIASNASCVYGACVYVDLDAKDNFAVVQVSGTFTATLQFEASADKTNYVSIAGTPSAGGSATSTTAAGAWQCNVSGYKVLRVRASALTSGTAVVKITTSQSALSNVNYPGVTSDGSGGLAVSTTVTAPNISRVQAQNNEHNAVGIIDWSRAWAPNAAAALTTPVPYIGSGVVHPSVYYNPAGWNGYKYWMAYTPMESDSAYENPSIAVSNDGQTWSTPAGVTNPLVGTPATSFNSDPDLVDGLDGYLYLVYRVMNDKLYYIRSNDGIHWGTRQPMFTPANWSVEDPVSPSMTFDGKAWTMYYLNNVTCSPLATNADCVVLKRTAPSISGPWSAATRLDSIGPATVANRNWWHLSAFRYNGQVVLVLTMMSQASQAGQLYLAWSNDAGSTFTLQPTYMLDSGVGGSWQQSIYRAAAVPVNDGSGRVKLGIWYSTTNHYIGYTEAKLSPNPQTAGTQYFFGGTIFPGMAETTCTPGFVANTTRGIQFVLPFAMKVKKVHVELTTAAAASSSSVALYDVNGKLVLATGAIDTSVTAGQLTVTLSSTVDVPAGTYWMAAATSDANVKFRCFNFGGITNTRAMMNSSATPKIFYFSDAANNPTAGVLPSSLKAMTTGAATGIDIPIVMFEP